MIKAFLFVYLFGAYLLINTNCSNIEIKLNKYQKMFLTMGLHKIKIFNLTKNSSHYENQSRYNLIIILWQIFWLIFLIIAPLCFKMLSNIIGNSVFEEIVRMYINCIQNIKNIFFAEVFMIAMDMTVKMIRRKS